MAFDQPRQAMEEAAAKRGYKDKHGNWVVIPIVERPFLFPTNDMTDQQISERSRLIGLHFD